MSKDLLREWKDRVEEVETQLRLSEHDERVLEKAYQQAKEKLSQHFQLVEGEKVKLLDRLDEAGGEAQRLQRACEETIGFKQTVEAAYRRTLEDYEKLHFAVRDLKELEEEKLLSRTNYQEALQKQSREWADEEHRLRSELERLQREEQERQKAREREREAVEKELHRYEAQLEAERAYRAAQAQSSAAPIRRMAFPSGRSRMQSLPLFSSDAPVMQNAAESGMPVGQINPTRPIRAATYNGSEMAQPKEEKIFRKRAVLEETTNAPLPSYISGAIV